MQGYQSFKNRTDILIIGAGLYPTNHPMTEWDKCNTMYENPPRTFETKEQCLEAAVIKEKATIEMLSDEDGYLVVEHLEVGCEQVNNT